MYLYDTNLKQKIKKNKNVRISIYFTEGIDYKNHNIHALGTFSFIDDISFSFVPNEGLYIIADDCHIKIEKVKYICIKEYTDNGREELWTKILGQNKLKALYNEGVGTIYNYPFEEYSNDCEEEYNKTVIDFYENGIGYYGE